MEDSYLDMNAYVPISEVIFVKEGNEEDESKENNFEIKEESFGYGEEENTIFIMTEGKMSENEFPISQGTKFAIVEQNKCDSDNLTRHCEDPLQLMPSVVDGDQGNLMLHKRTHTMEKPYVCECPKAFPHRGCLVRHMRVHTQEKPFSCELCGKAFLRKNRLVHHVRTHTGEKPYNCNECGKKFPHKGKLVEHLRIHTGEKPFIGEFCSNAFSKKNYLMGHRRVHTKEKPHASASLFPMLTHIAGTRPSVRETLAFVRATFSRPSVPCESQFISSLDAADNAKLYPCNTS
ncbi:zinc finger protein 12-like [Penaeus japonicus]|uniref:zinc finger protein 12-like n=1 Tax=Penaeus japonicus TaxID=27405 RepID=UPI001C70E19C|nr:zinc finger protein 12-like [Penaeus japonicus]